MFETMRASGSRLRILVPVGVAVSLAGVAGARWLATPPDPLAASRDLAPPAGDTCRLPPPALDLTQEARTMTAATTPLHRVLPPLDAQLPRRLATATFAAG